MQIAKATTVLVNNGIVRAPHLLKDIIDNDATVPAKFDEYPPITNVDQKYWDIAKNGMYRVLFGTRGTARRAFYGAEYKAGGKSGSAQVFGLAEDQKYNAEELEEHLRDHALFTAFAPYEKPEIVVSMVLENAGGGSSNGGPVARKIFDHILLKPKLPDQSQTVTGAKLAEVSQ